MSARDKYHNQVRNALIKDGWTITDDPLRLEWGRKDAYVDLGAEQIVAAEKEQRKIAVEIKTFLGTSEVRDLENAYGQYMLYQDILEEVEPERIVYLAVQRLNTPKYFRIHLADCFSIRKECGLSCLTRRRRVYSNGYPRRLPAAGRGCSERSDAGSFCKRRHRDTDRF